MRDERVHHREDGDGRQGEDGEGGVPARLDPGPAPRRAAREGGGAPDEREQEGAPDGPVPQAARHGELDSRRSCW